ncbi:MAG TPA: hypothetical protein VMT15_11100 [Bryobacteraceae bacterium]|nr:hypothetical protein [Bryobacteraceae bacterium]
MRAISWFLRVFCYLFHTVFSIALVVLGGLAFLAGATNMKLQSIPWWQGTTLNCWLVGLGLLGLLSVFLAITGKVRALLALWSICVLGLLIRDVFLSLAVTFSGREDFHNWLLLTAGAALAMIGSFLVLMRRPAY